MKKIGLFFGALFFCSSVWAQSVSLTDIVRPLRYEQREGRLQVLSYVKLSDGSVPKLNLKLNGRQLAYEKTSRADSVLVWLPMVGQKNLLTLNRGNMELDARMVECPINSDWGYFKNGVIHIIQSSHQDIAWMDTPEYCRNERIHDIIIPALDMMKEDPEFTFEMEQTLNLMEFLEVYPERRQEVIDRYKEGRFAWGATFNQPYEGLSSGEQLVRQTYFGRKWILENMPGCDDRTANNVDVPGRTMQMPQILAKSGVDNLLVSRMGEGFYDWYSPDGSKVLTYTPGNYGWATLIWKYFSRDAVYAMQKLQARTSLWNDYFEQHHLPPHYAILMSCDATKPASFKEIIREWNDIAERSEVELPRLTTSTVESYLNKVKVDGASFRKIEGERPNLWLYIHGPAHYQQTLDKRRAGVVLPAAETFTTIASVSKGQWNYPRDQFDRAWMASIYPDHGLGGKNGETTDGIYADSLHQAYVIGKELLHNSLDGLTADIAAREGDLVVFNDLTWNRTTVVEYPLEQSQEVAVTDVFGREVPSQIGVNAEGERVLRFVDTALPSLGYKTYRLKTVKKNRAVLPDGVSQTSNSYSNRYYDLLFGDGGITCFYDKELKRNLAQTEKFAFGDVIDAGYTGNGAGEFTRIRNLVPGDLTALSSVRADWKITQTGALFTCFENVVPSKFARVIQRITVYHDIKKIDFDVCIENFTGEHNRQYRIMFPLDMKVSQSAVNYEVPMGVARVGEHEMKEIPYGWAWEGTYEHHPADSHPREIQNFISANGNGFGCTVSSCVAVADWIDPSREQADYVVLQGVLLSSHKSCHGEGNWYHQKGTHRFHFSVLGHAEDWRNCYAYALDANHPALVCVKRNAGGQLKMEDSLITVSDRFVALSTLKKADTEDAVILRLVEMEGVDKEVVVTLPFAARRVVKCNLIEQNGEETPLKGNELKIKMEHHSIETYKIYL